MASSTNPRVRRINQLLRIKNSDSLPDGYHIGKPTYSQGYANLGNPYSTCQVKEHNTNPVQNKWNYNAYPKKDQKKTFNNAYSIW